MAIRGRGCKELGLRPDPGSSYNGAMRDHELMELALTEAARAADEGEVPVGAVVALAGEIIGRGRNQRETLADPTAHAEILALREASAHQGTWHLDDAVLCVTLEPCPMCAGALVNARVARLVYGCTDPKAGAVDSLYELCTDPRLNHRLAVVPGVRADECAAQLKQFFTRLRSRDRPPKPRAGP
jgi:tRNA(adenine34) deaminase